MRTSPESLTTFPARARHVSNLAKSGLENSGRLFCCLLPLFGSARMLEAREMPKAGSLRQPRDFPAILVGDYSRRGRSYGCTRAPRARTKAAPHFSDLSGMQVGGGSGGHWASAGVPAGGRGRACGGAPGGGLRARPPGPGRLCGREQGPRPGRRVGAVHPCQRAWDTELGKACL